MMIGPQYRKLKRRQVKVTDFILVLAQDQGILEMIIFLILVFPFIKIKILL